MKRNLLKFKNDNFLWLVVGICLLLFIALTDSIAQGTISFDDQGFTSCQELSDNHNFSAIGKSFRIYAANFDGTVSSGGSLWYETASGGCWHSYATEMKGGGYITAGYTSLESSQWIDPEALVLKTSDGSEFKFVSFKAHDAGWQSWGNYLKVSGYKDGSFKGSESVTLVSHTEPYHSTVTLTDPIFANIDEVRIIMDKDNNPDFGNPSIQNSNADGLFHSFDTFVVDNASGEAIGALLPGDLAFIGLNSDVVPDEFAIVALAEIPSGETIYISDYGWDGTAFSTKTNGTEGAITWTITSSIPAGTVLHFSIQSPAGTPIIGGDLSAFGTVSATGWTLGSSAVASGGDNWFIYQGASRTSAPSTWIFGFANFSTDVGGTVSPGEWLPAGSPTATTSQLPAALTLGTTAVGLTTTTYHADNMVYTGIRVGDKASLLTLIGTRSNWNGNESVTQNISPGGANFPGTNPIFLMGGTPNTIPAVSTSAATSVTATGVTLSGNVTDNGGDPVTERGFVYAASSSPTTSDVKIQDGSGTGAFSEAISGLDPETTYYVRAYAINGEGTSYGSEESFTTSVALGETTVFWSDDFEDATSPSSGTRTPSNNGGSSNAYFKRATNADLDLTLVSDGNYSNFQGAYFWAGEDHDAVFANGEQNIVWSGISITGKTAITFKGLFGAQFTHNAFDHLSFGNSHTDYVIVEYSIDGGSYTPMISFYAKNIEEKQFYEDTNNDGIGDGILLTKSFKEFNKSIPGTGDQLTIRMRAYSNNTANEEWAIDNFRLESSGPENAAPTASNIPMDITVTEDVASNINLSAVSFAEADGDALTVTLSASAGTLTAASGGGVTVGGSGTGALTLAGTAANINTFLDTQSNIKYTGAANASGNNAATLTINANDGTVNPQLGGVNINITAVNDSPTLAGIPSDITVTEDVASNMDLSSATFADFDGEALTATLSASSGTLAATSGEGVTISGSGSATLSLAGTAASITTYLNTISNIKYTSASNANGNNAATLTINVNDGTVNPQLGTVNIDITAVNDAPVASNAAFTGTLEVGGLLTGSYDYSDIESNTESGTAFKWYRYDVSSGSTGKTQIGTGSTYTLAAADESKYISFQVTPNDGTDTGTPVESTRKGPVTDPASDMHLKGNSVAIADGDATSSAADHTDFGSIATASGTISRTFTIENAGSLDLTLVDDDGRGYVSVSGANASDFTVTTQPNENTGPAGTTTFVIEFDPSAIGERNGTVNISSNDPDENPYTFAIKGTGSNTAPVMSSSATVSIDENTTSVMTVTAMDADSHTLSFSISGGDDAALFSINASSGALSFDDARDFEDPEDDGTNNNYEVEITISDGNGGTDVQTVAVTIKDKNDNSPVFTSSDVVEIDENSTTVVTAAATDADAGSTITYSITAGDDQALFSIHSSAGTLAFISAPDFEDPTDANTDNGYKVQVTASDGTHTTAQTISVSVKDVNDNSPVFSSSNSADVDENTTSVVTVAATDADASATLTFSITGGADQELFDIDVSTGALTFDSAPDFERPTDDNSDNDYIVQVRVSDGTNSVSQTLTVSVNDLNDESPVFTSAATANMDENTTDALTVKATDADKGSLLSFSISGGTDQALFSINASSGALVFEDAPDFEAPADDDTDNEYVVQVTASDGTNSSNQTITVTIDGLNDEKPVFTSASGADADENKTSVITVAATDADAASTIAYSITGGTDQALFSIKGSTGVLTFRRAPDYENPADADTDNEYVVQVTASDGANTTDQSITVSVQNLNDNAPIINNATYALDENSLKGSAVGINQASDADGDAITYSITGGNTGNSFAVDNSGKIKVNDNNALDYETIPSFTLTVNVTDGSFSDQAIIKINLNDLNDNTPVITSTAIVAVNEDDNYAYVIAATDADAGEELVFSAGTVPAWLTLMDHGDGTATLSGIPTNDAVGTHEITIEVIDEAGAKDVQDFEVTVINVNDAPIVQIEIQDQKAFTEQAFHYAVPESSFLDVDEGDELTVMAELSNGNPLPAWLSFDAEKQTFSGIPTLADLGSLTLKVMVSDKSNASVADSFVLNVEPSNHTPTDILLSNIEIEEHKPAVSLVGNFSTIDKDQDDVHTYVLVGGEGSEDNGSFQIEGDKLLTSLFFDYEIQNSYSIRVQVTDNSGAMIEKAFTIEVLDIQDARVFIPNLFSPNDDGNNDTFRARSSEIKQINFRVFNYMGEMVFETSDEQKAVEIGWDGRYKGKDQPSGTYVWQISGQFKDGTPISFKGKNTGNITLIR